MRKGVPIDIPSDCVVNLIREGLIAAEELSEGARLAAVSLHGVDDAREQVHRIGRVVRTAGEELARRRALLLRGSQPRAGLLHPPGESRPGLLELLSEVMGER